MGRSSPHLQAARGPLHQPERVLIHDVGDEPPCGGAGAAGAAHRRGVAEADHPLHLRHKTDLPRRGAALLAVVQPFERMLHRTKRGKGVGVCDR